MPLHFGIIDWVDKIKQIEGLRGFKMEEAEVSCCKIDKTTLQT